MAPIITAVGFPPMGPSVPGADPPPEKTLEPRAVSVYPTGMPAAWLLLALAAVPAPAAVSTQEWPLTPAESLRLEREHAEVAGRLAATLDAVERLRGAFGASKDPDAALAAWTAELAAAQPLHDRALALNKRHRDGMGETDRHIVLWSLAYLKERERAYLESSPEYKAINARNKAIDIRMETLFTRLVRERQRRDEAAALRARQRENEKEARLLYAALGAAAAALAGVAAYVLSRPRPAPPSPPPAEIIKLS